MSGVFITGTDTGVGKTLVAAALARALRGAGVDAVPMKPVQTGCVRRGGAWSAPDLDFSLAAAGLAATPAERELMAPYRFRPACSPHLAARQAGRQIRLPVIRRAFARLAARHAFVVAEGAGGVLVPLDDRRTMADLIAALAVPVVVVARAGLGTINHTLLSIRALRDARLTVVAIVLNQAVPGRPGMIERDNRRTIERLTGVPVAASLAYGVSLPGAAQSLGPLAALLLREARPGGKRCRRQGSPAR